MFTAGIVKILEHREDNFPFVESFSCRALEKPAIPMQLPATNVKMRCVPSVLAAKLSLITVSQRLCKQCRARGGREGPFSLESIMGDALLSYHVFILTYEIEALSEACFEVEMVWNRPPFFHGIPCRVDCEPSSCPECSTCPSDCNDERVLSQHAECVGSIASCLIEMYLTIVRLILHGVSAVNTIQQVVRGIACRKDQCVKGCSSVFSWVLCHVASTISIEVFTTTESQPLGTKISDPKRQSGLRNILCKHLSRVFLELERLCKMHLFPFPLQSPLLIIMYAVHSRKSLLDSISYVRVPFPIQLHLFRRLLPTEAPHALHPTKVIAQKVFLIPFAGPSFGSPSIVYGASTCLIFRRRG